MHSITFTRDTRGRYYRSIILICQMHRQSCTRGVTIACTQARGVCIAFTDMNAVNMRGVLHELLAQNGWNCGKPSCPWYLPWSCLLELVFFSLLMATRICTGENSMLSIDADSETGVVTASEAASSSSAQAEPKYLFSKFARSSWSTTMVCANSLLNWMSALLLTNQQNAPEQCYCQWPLAVPFLARTYK